jgi:hypothetical protein
MDFLGQLGPGPSQPTESETKDFLSDFLKGKIWRRISGSGAVKVFDCSCDLRSY